MRTAIGGENQRPTLVDLPNDFDWMYFLNQVFTHALGPLTYTRLKDEVSVPEEVRSILQSHSENVARSNLHQYCELIRLMRALKEANIPALAYKGPTLAHCAYGSIAMRSFSDLDIMVPRKCFADGLHVLQENGYSMSKAVPKHLEKWWLSTQHDYSLISKNGDGQVELHWDVAERQFAFHFDVQAMCRRSQSSTLHADIDTMSIEDMLVVLCVHGSKHGWERLVWVCDIASVLQKSIADESLDWDVLLQRASEAGATRALYLGLVLAYDFLNLPGLYASMPDALKASIEKDVSVQELYRRVQACLFVSTEERGNMSFPNFTYFWHLRNAKKDKVLYAWRRTTELNTRDLVMGDLPRHFHSFYYGARSIRLCVKAMKWVGAKVSFHVFAFFV